MSIGHAWPSVNGTSGVKFTGRPEWRYYSLRHIAELIEIVRVL